MFNMNIITPFIVTNNRNKSIIAIRDGLNTLTKSTYATPLCKNIDSKSTNAAERLNSAINIAIGASASFHAKDTDHKKISKIFIEALVDGLQPPLFSETQLSVLLGYGLDGAKDYEKTPYGFLDTKTFKTNLHSHTGKLRKSTAHGLPAYPEIKEAPALGITSRSYDCHSIHLARNNLGIIANLILNQYILIDQRYCRLQSLLTGQRYSQLVARLLPDAPECIQAFSEKLISSIDEGECYSDITHVDENFRTVTLRIGEGDSYLNLSPLASIEIVEDLHNQLRRYGGHKISMAVGDGNPVNLGSYASNRGGSMEFIVQPNPNALSYQKTSSQLLLRFKKQQVISTLDRQRWQKSKNPHETKSNFEKRRTDGLLKAMLEYKRYLSHLFELITDQVSKEVEDVKERRSATNLLFEQQAVDELWSLYQGKLGGHEVSYLAGLIFWELYGSERAQLSEADSLSGLKIVSQIIREHY